MRKSPGASQGETFHFQSTENVLLVENFGSLLSTLTLSWILYQVNKTQPIASEKDVLAS